MATDTDQTVETPTVLLTGASSQIGVFAIPRLLRAGFSVLAISRNGRPQSYPAFEQVKWLDMAAAIGVSSGCQYLLSAGPMELAQKFLAHGQQFKSVVIFSSSSVEIKQDSADLSERSQIQNLLRLESELQSIAQNTNIKLVILRPTLIYGCGLDTNISRLASLIRRFGFMPVNGKAAGLRQPVHADDLACVAITALLSKNSLPRVLTLTGGDTLTYADMVIKIFKALGKPARLVHLPEWLFILLIKFTNAFNAGRGDNSEMVRRQRLDLVFEDRQARQLLSYVPRPFAPAAEDFSLPVYDPEAPPP